MKKATAIAILNDFRNETYSTDDRMEAIIEVLEMKTKRDVKKDSLIEALQFTVEVIAGLLQEQNVAEKERK